MNVNLFIIINIIFMSILLIAMEQKVKGYAFSLNSYFIFLGCLYSIGPLLSPESTIVDAEYWSIGLFLCVIYTYSISVCVVKCSKVNRGYLERSLHIYKLKFFLICLFILSLSMFLYVVVVKIGVNDFLFSSRAQRSILTRQFSVYMFFKDLLCAISALSLLIYFKYKDDFFKYLWLVTFIFSLVYALVTISRTQIILIVFPVIFILNYYKVISNKIVNVVIVSGVFFALIWKWLLYSIIFNGEVDMSTFTISVPSELYQWAITGQNTSREYMHGGGSFLDAVMSLFHPFYNTEALSVWYVNKYEPLVASDGGGRGFSLYVESILNFGYLGLPLIFTMVGIGLGLITRLSLKYCFFVYVTCITLPYLHRIFRSELLSITKTWWWFYIIPIGIIFLFSLKRYKNVKHNS